MLPNIIKKLSIPIVCILLLLAPRLSTAYTVSGLIEFSYRDYETKVGSSRTSYKTFTQTYGVNVAAPVYDPRFLVISGGVGYDIISTLSSNYPDYSTLSYNLNMQFFPSSMIGWDLYGRKNTSTYQSTLNIGGYDVTTTSYGGSLHLSLSRSGKGGNNGNSNFTNDARMSNIPRPDIFISHDHTESEALTASAPLSETRDYTQGEVRFNGASYYVNFTGTVENYSNAFQYSSYDVSTLGVMSNVRVAPNGELILNGLETYRTTHNISGYDAVTSSDNLNAQLSFNDTKRISHFYRYDYIQQYDSNRRFTSSRFDAQATYRANEEVTLRGGINYFQADFFRQATASTPEEKNVQSSGGLIAGASYAHLYRPEFLGPFGFNTAYDFTSGISSVSSEVAGARVGSGLYYGNHLNLALNSLGWKSENVTLDYTYDNRRDHSPAANQFQTQSFRLNALTSRLPRTTTQASASYTVRNTSTNIADPFSVMLGDQTTQNRSWIYSIDIRHALTPEVALNAGATKSNVAASSNYSISTLPNRTLTDNELIYISMNYNTMVTRSMNFSAELREEKNRVANVDSDVSNNRMMLNYRIRMILISLEYRWLQTVYDQGLRTIQQYTFAKISRPF